MDLVRVYETNKHRIRIYRDYENDGPEDWDRLGTLWAFHERFALGDKPDVKSNDFKGWEALEAYLKKERNAVVVLPVYMIDHSGQAISTKPFNDHWDSGQVGFIWTTREKIKKEKATLKKAKKILEQEIKAWNDWLTGNVYGFVVENLDPLEDSCWGFYGDDFTYLLGKAVGVEEAKTAKEVKE